MTLLGPAQEMLTDHTYVMTLLTAAVIGTTAGTLGSFTYLRHASLIADVVSHASLPGTMAAFLALTALGADPRSDSGLLLGAAAAGTAAVYLTGLVTRLSPVRQDASMAVVLSTTFGLGMVLLQHIMNTPYPGKGGVQDYLFGNASAITRSDLRVSVVVSVVLLGVVTVVFRALILRAFDPVHARVLGWRTGVLDAVTAVAIVVATVIGAKAVGLVLMVAFVVTPPVIARQWTRRPGTMVAVSGLVGLFAAAAGTYVSLAAGPLPTGPVIVVVLACALAVSLTVSPRARRARRGSRREPERKEEPCSSSASGR